MCNIKIGPYKYCPLEKKFNPPPQFNLDNSNTAASVRNLQLFLLSLQVRYVAEVIVCVNSVIYLIMELVEIRLQGLLAFFKNQVSHKLLCCYWENRQCVNPLSVLVC